MDTAVTNRLVDKIADVRKAKPELGPIDEIANEISGIFQKSLPNVRAAVSETKRLREKLLVLLDRPKTAYDDRVMEFYTLLSTIDINERQTVRKMLDDTDRKLLHPYVARADWLALEEKAPARLRSGLTVHALTLPDFDDYRDVMVSLAPTHVVAKELGMDVPSLFKEASTYAGEGVAKTMIEFGARDDISLEAFGHRRIETEEGVRFRQQF